MCWPGLALNCVNYTYIHQNIVVHRGMGTNVSKTTLFVLHDSMCTLQHRTTRCVVTPRFVVLHVFACTVCILCSQLCCSGYFVSDSIVVDMSLKLYAVCQRKLVSWQSVNMTNSLVYNIARETETLRGREGEGWITLVVSVQPQLWATDFVSHTHVTCPRNVMCVCVCWFVCMQYVCTVSVWTIHLYPHINVYICIGVSLLLNLSDSAK